MDRFSSSSVSTPRDRVGFRPTPFLIDVVFLHKPGACTACRSTWSAQRATHQVSSGSLRFPRCCRLLNLDCATSHPSFVVSCSSRNRPFFLFTSKAGSTDHFHWFMDYIVGLFTSSVEEYALLNALLHMSVPFKRTWELKAMSRCQVARSRICSNTTVYVGVPHLCLVLPVAVLIVLRLPVSCQQLESDF